MVMRLLVVVALLAALAGCSREPRILTYDGPEVTRVIINKGPREMFLMHHDQVLEAYRVDLGFAAEGHKLREGDGRTPEGDYTIDRRNPESAYHLSLGISYPDEEDVARARAMGVDPGGDIFIHGESRRFFGPGPDWTAGCISVRNREIEQIYAMAPNGTPITINP